MRSGNSKFWGKTLPFNAVAKVPVNAATEAPNANAISLSRLTGMSAMGLYSMVATLLISRFAFGVDLPLEHPFAFAVALVATVVSIGAMGFLLAVSFVRYRTAWALGNLLEYPVWLIAGFLVPLTLLPGWVRPISWRSTSRIRSSSPWRCRRRC